MAKKLYEESNISAIAAAIRTKNGSQDTYLVSEMADAIDDIVTEPDLETLLATQNDTYTPSQGKDGFSQVVVNVPSIQPVLITKSITQNGTYIALDDDSADGYSSVTVNVPGEVLPAASGQSF